MKFIVDKSEKVRYTKRVRCKRYKNKTHRCVAQLGRALRSGRRGRRFKSCHFDYLAGAPKTLEIRFSVFFFVGIKSIKIHLVTNLVTNNTTFYQHCKKNITTFKNLMLSGYFYISPFPFLNIFSSLILIYQMLI